MVRITFLLALLVFPSVLFAAPSITGVLPPIGQAGDVVTITGAGFAGDPKLNIVRFGPNRAPVLTSTAAALTVQVPNGQPLGPTIITVSIGNSSIVSERSNASPKVTHYFGANSKNKDFVKMIQGTSGSFHFITVIKSKRISSNPAKTCCDPCTGLYTAPCPYDSRQGHKGGNTGGRSGNVYAERLEFYQYETDLSIPGRPGSEQMVQYAFRREYRSQVNTDGPLGHNWDHNYFERVVVQIDGSVIHQNMTRNDHYHKNNKGNLVAPPELFTVLTMNADSTFTLMYRNRTSKTFHTDGKLLEIRDRNNNFMTFHYNALGQLDRVNDTLGRDIVYRYSGGHLSEIEDFFGRKVKFTHDGQGDLVEVTSPAVTGTPNGNDFPSGKTTRYTYSFGFGDERLNHNLLTVTKPNEVATGGAPILINEYGTNPGIFEFDKLTRQTYGGKNASGLPAGGTFTFSITQLNAGIQSDDPNLPVTRTRESDRNGNVEELEFNRLGFPIVRREFTRGLRSTDPLSYETRMAFNADGLLVRQTFPAGNFSEYTYDEGDPDRLKWGNLLTQTQNPGLRGGDQATLFTQYTYEPSFNHITSVTDPRGNTKTYTYDTRGNRTQKREPTVILPDGAAQQIITDYAYNTFGQMISETDPEGNVDEYFYFPENDPDGDGDSGPGTRPGLDTSTGGYLKQKITDSMSSLRRVESTPPARISNLFFYDPVGNIIRTIDGRGNDTLFSVNQLNQVVRKQTEPPFRYIQDTFYDFNNNVIETRIENQAPAAIDGKPIFTGDGNFSSQQGSPAFFVHRYTFDILDKMVQNDEDATGSNRSRLITKYRYDANENLIEEIFPKGNIFASVYDDRDLLLTRTRGVGSPDASTVAFRYDPNRNLVAVLDGRGNTTTIQLDGFDRKTGTIDALGNRLIRNLDPNGNVLRDSRFGPVGGSGGGGSTLLSEREYQYDALNRAFQKDDRLFIAAATMRPIILTDGPLSGGDGKVSMRTIFDRNSRPLQTMEDDLDTRTMEYDGVDRMVNSSDPEGNVTIYTYDGNNNLVILVQIERSQKGGITETFTTTSLYDSLDRLTQISDNCGNTKRQAYDSRDNLTHSTDAKGDGTVGCPRTINSQGNSMRYTYDGMNRKLQEVQDLRVGGVGSAPIDTSNSSNPDSRITTISNWDGNSRLSSLIDDKGNETKYTYDALNRLTVETFADGTTKTYKYDKNDNPINIKDNNDTVQNCIYDAIDRRTRCDIVRASGVVGTTLNTYEYDGLSRLTKMTDNNDPNTSADDSTVAISYDSLRRIVEEVQNGKAVSGDWFGRDRRVALTYPNSRKIALTFDRLDRVRTIQDQGTSSVIVQYDYIGPGRVLERGLQNGVRLTYLNDTGTADIGYDGVKRMVNHRHLRSNNTLVAGFGYSYDREDNKRFEEKLHAVPQSELYAYDSAYRIIDFKRGQLTPPKDGIVTPVKQEQWTLDGVWNWRVNIEDGQVHTFTPNSVNEYTTVNSNALFYDKNGNVTNDGSNGFRWDYRNRLRQVCRLDMNNPNGSDGKPGTADDCLSQGARLLSTYRYDANNRRFQKDVTNSGTLNGRTDFYYDGWQAIEERDSADTVMQQYVFGIYMDEPLVLDRNMDGDNNAIGAGDQRLFYHQNTQYSVFALTDKNAAVVEGYQYDPYGRQTVFGPDFMTPIANGQSARGNPYMFTGQRLDPETGLIYFKNRYYSTNLGRFISRDPIGYHSEMNLFAAYFVPNELDPLGLFDWADYFEAVKETYIGMGESVVDTAVAVGTAVAHPIDTAENVGTAIAHPIDTAKAIAEDIAEKAETDRGRGNLVGSGLQTLTGVGLAKKVAEAAKAAKIAKKLEKAAAAAKTLAEQLAIKEAAGKGGRIMKGLIKDPKFPESEWAKMEYVHEACDGSKTTVHYWRNLKTGQEGGFKVK